MSGDTASLSISVVMPCYNAAASIVGAVESVLTQTYGCVQLVVVDDGSTDDSLEVLRRYRDRVEVITQANRGPGPARNRGITAAQGELLAFLDADDYWRPDCLERMCTALVESGADIAYCGWQNVGAPGGRGAPYLPPDYEDEGKVEHFLAGCPWPIHACLLRTEQVREIGGFSERWVTSEDYDLWLNMASFRRLVLVPEVLAFYRHHSATQITRDRARAAREQWLVQRQFVRRHPEAVAHLKRRRLHELIDGQLLHRAYCCFWERDLVGAQAIFRQCLARGAFGIGDLKYIVAACLPMKIFERMVHFADGARETDA